MKIHLTSGKRTHLQCHPVALNPYQMKPALAFVATNFHPAAYLDPSVTSVPGMAAVLSRNLITHSAETNGIRDTAKQSSVGRSRSSLTGKRRKEGREEGME